MFKDTIQIVGLGQCGSRIGKEFEKLGAFSLYVNSDEVDFRDLDVEESHMLLLHNTGTGRSPDKGEQIFTENKDKFMSFLNANLTKEKIVLFIAGGGGGSGGGFVCPAVEFAKAQGYRTAVLYTLPPKMLGMLATTNSLKTLKNLKNIETGTLILADNEYLIKTIGTGKDWWQNVNRYIVKTIYSAFDIVRNSKVTQSGFGSIDKGEIMRIFQYGKGLMDVRTVYIPLASLDADDKTLHKVLFEPTMIQRYDYRRTLAYLVNVDIPKFVNANINFSKQANRIFDITKKVSGSSVSILGMFMDPELTDHIRVTMINSGLKLPKILQSSINNLKRDEQRLQDKMNRDDELDLDDIGEGLVDTDFII